MKPTHSPADHCFEDVEVRGHIIDSLILPRILDSILQAGGSFNIKQIQIGHEKHDPSVAILEVRAPTRPALQEILAQIGNHGAVPIALEDCHLMEADMDGAFPESFYSTTNQRTEIRVCGTWIDVERQEMDCGIIVPEGGTAPYCLPMVDVRRGMPVVVGHQGVRVFPSERPREQRTFEFMNSNVSTEKPKGVALRNVADFLRKTKATGQKSALVGGPAIVHTGSVEHVEWMIRHGYCTCCWPAMPWRPMTSNRRCTVPAWAWTSIMEIQSRPGTNITCERSTAFAAPGVSNRRRTGTADVEASCTSACSNEVDFLLAGSIRDDGPLPEVITDVWTLSDRCARIVAESPFV